MYAFSYRCEGIEFDYHDSDKVLIRDEYKYYLTPKLLAKIETWMIKENIEIINTKEQMEYCIDQGWLQSY